VCSGRAAVSKNDKNVAKVSTTTISDQCAVTEDITNEIGISHGSAENIVKGL
jgi:hypothetical protein